MSRRRRSFGEIYRAERASIDRDPYSRAFSGVRVLPPVLFSGAIGVSAFAAGGWGPVVGVCFLALAAVMAWLVLSGRW